MGCVSGELREIKDKRGGKNSFVDKNEITAVGTSRRKRRVLELTAGSLLGTTQLPTIRKNEIHTADTFWMASFSLSPHLLCFGVRSVASGEKKKQNASMRCAIFKRKVYSTADENEYRQGKSVVCVGERNVARRTAAAVSGVLIRTDSAS